MKSVRIYFEEIADMDNLFQAAMTAARGKRNRPDVAAFFDHLTTPVFAFPELNFFRLDSLTFDQAAVPSDREIP